MRPEQIDRLVALEEELADVFVKECQPKAWPKTETQQGRGDRYWYKKNALATLTLVSRIQTVLREIRAGDGGGEKSPGRPAGADGEETRDEEIRRLNREGIAILDRHRKRQGAK